MQIGCSLHFSFLVAFWFPVFTSSIKIFFPFSAKIINRIDRTTYIRLQKKKSQILKSFFFIFIQLQKFWSLLEIRLQNFITTLKSKTFYAINTVHISSILFIFWSDWNGPWSSTLFYYNTKIQRKKYWSSTDAYPNSFHKQDIFI